MARQRIARSVATYLVAFVFSIVSTSAAQVARRSISNGWPIRPVETSPRITELKQRLASGGQDALKEFWQDAHNSGTPLIEPVKGTPREVIVTFLWHGDQYTENVVLLAPLTNSPGLPELPLAHVLETDVWYGSWRMRDDFRFTYRFVVNLKPGQNAQQLATVDPLNTHEMEVSFEGSHTPATRLSIAAMPHAAEERWIVTQHGVPTGRVESYTLQSAILRSERQIWVYTPPGYSAKAPAAYRLLVLFDGFSYQHWIPVPTILDNLIHAQKLPPTIAVLIDNPQESRGSDLGYNPEFVNFLGDELLPWLHRRLNVTYDPQMTIIGGYSMGGAAAAFAAAARPDLFGNVLCQSGSFWEGHENTKWEFLTSRYEASPKLPLRFFMEAGLLEDVSKDGPTLLAANRRLAELLKSKGYQVTYEEVGGTHEPVHWRDTLPQGLMALVK